MPFSNQTSYCIYQKKKAGNNSKPIILQIKKIILKFYEIKNAILSSVVEVDNNLINFLKKNIFLNIILDSDTKIPLTNLYKTPKTIGKDRIAAVVGANNIYPNCNILIFDAGTALTIDFINKKNEYVGGNISPGLTMRYKALNKFTQKLPLYKIKHDFDKLTGQTTKEAIIAGVQNGILFEINNYIKIFSKKYTDLKIFLTGGDIFFFENKLKKNIFAEPNLVLIGLNRILTNNANKD